MRFEKWLQQIGKSERTAHSYAGAIAGAISEWGMDAGVLDQPLTHIQSLHVFNELAEQIKQLDTFQQHNARGNNMYSAALNQYAAYLDDVLSESLQEDIEKLLTNDVLDKTEKTTLISARVGQGKFRDGVIDQWRGCALTGFSDTRFLVASHIKPWRNSDNRERLDRFNGLLLLPNLDKVFDLGFITFRPHGGIEISRRLENERLLGISKNMHIQLDEAHQDYMEFHREHVYEKRFVS